MTWRKVRKKKDVEDAPRKRNNRRYAGIVIFSVDEYGAVRGYVENSFSMSFSDSHVRVFRHTRTVEKASDHNKYWQKEAASLQRRHTHTFVFMCRIGTKGCPLVIDWKNYYNLLKAGKLGKYDYRNLCFCVDEMKMEDLIRRRFQGPCCDAAAAQYGRGSPVSLPT